jgi:inner membrane protein
MDNAQPPVIPTPARRRLAIFLKIGGIGLLIALLHIPLGLTHGVLRERQGFQAQATQEIAGIWGKAQQVTGPVLAVPYACKTMVIRQKIVGDKVVPVEEPGLTWSTAYFLPDKLAVQGKVEPEVRHRGIYDAVVYSTKLKFAGDFLPDFAAAGIEHERVDWAQARLLFGVSDLRGVRSVGPVQLTGGAAKAFEPAESGSFLPLEARLEGVGAGQRLEFSLEVALQGSEFLQLVPVGKTTSVLLESPWADPSFMGAYLPVERSVGEAGFKARWETSHFSRGFPASWSDRTTQAKQMQESLGAAAFGVRFAQLADGYSMVERAQKYGVLFFVLIFAVFFLFEVTGGLRIHPLQYGMVGAALCLFFLGFLALSEFWPTGRAYAVAAGACTLMVAGYAWNFLRTGLRTLVIGGGLGATYGYLYFVLKSQDYALLAGTSALFAVLAAVMFFTRRVDWFAQEAGKAEARA